ncbi:MAG: DUF6504 family protein [Actinomycetales bacterium]
MERLQVDVDGTGVPSRFRWRGRWYRVEQVHAYWVEAGPWWSDRAPSARVSLGSSAGWVSERRSIWRVEALAHTGYRGVYDLASGADGWQLMQVMD